MANSHLQRVRILYKTILKLHCGLPNELKVLGTNYVREEFKRHKKCNVQEAEVFMKEWTNYAITLAEQLGLRGPQTGSSLGANLSKSDLEKFKDDQIYQLYELLEAARTSKN
ncbi:succinate dehydrogenase assembly factor 3, mitochondrial [Tribolium castaneum]|uniref:Succinate dehydrogenase assembly factor 3 n=1 Tax=Tribolium castaneum TaxID=7070 RepID=A0A139WFT2_TRICA|nr:PREDICTED: succinate dehydrogenase assembly factor 3, mitochondrial [Tribolium castaneum]KYB26786.1 Protein ACN9 homolog, mitochondrial-like Protein [Tribolium castaneum]|eukprot:XP_008195196.1 PREDICTED: succinate dehydrogenase assembly factor 3, mitochondrial [Tribolium castaneum]